MTEPTLIGTKVELRFDTKLGARDCLPSAHRVMRESFNLTADDSSFPISITTDSVEETVLSIIQQGYDLAAEETDKDTIIQHLLEKEC